MGVSRQGITDRAEVAEDRIPQRFLSRQKKEDLPE